MQYSAKVMDHFANPRNVGEFSDADGVGEVGNPACGDIMKMSIIVKDNVIVDVKFKTFGCGAAIATSSISTEMIKGKTLEGSPEAHEQGGSRGAGWTASGKDALLGACRRGHRSSHRRLSQEKNG